MSDLISRQDAIALVIKAIHGTDNKEIQEYLFDGLRKQMWSLPSADRPTGRWIDYSDEGYVECPFCHSATTCDGNKDELHFCFSCGAKMEGGEEE